MGESKRRKLLGTDKVPNGKNNRTPKIKKYDMSIIHNYNPFKINFLSPKEIIRNIRNKELRKVL